MREKGSFERAVLGRTGREMGRLGVAASYGIGASGVEMAVEAGVSYLYWGSLRTRAFGRGIRNCVRRGLRDRMTIVIQSYSRVGLLVRPSLECALRGLGIDHADVLLLGWWNAPPRAAIVDAARACREKRLVRWLGLSTHHRPLAADLAAETSPFDVLHVRYNACHRGAEREVFPRLPQGARPDGRPRAAGIVAFTATLWGSLLEPPPGLPPGVPVPTAGDCYRFVLTNPAVNVCLTGPKDDGEMRDALAALEKGPMDEDELAWMRRVGDLRYAKGRVRNIVEKAF